MGGNGGGDEPDVGEATDAADSANADTHDDYSAIEVTEPPPETPVVAAAGKDWIVATSGYCDKASSWQKVKWVADGDTIQLKNGDKVRFLMVDTPELSSKDCQSQEALNFSRAELTSAGEVCLESDAAASNVDMYKRLLRYVWYKRDGKIVQLNARLLRLGLARVFYPYAYGLKYEDDGLAMQSRAASEGLGGWADCGW